MKAFRNSTLATLCAVLGVSGALFVVLAIGAVIGRSTSPQAARQPAIAHTEAPSVPIAEANHAEVEQAIWDEAGVIARDRLQNATKEVVAGFTTAPDMSIANYVAINKEGRLNYWRRSHPSIFTELSPESADQLRDEFYASCIFIADQEIRKISTDEYQSTSFRQIHFQAARESMLAMEFMAQMMVVQVMKAEDHSDNP